MKSKLYDYLIVTMQDGVHSEVRYHQATDRTAIDRAERMALELGGDFDLGTGRVSVFQIENHGVGSATYKVIWTQNVDQQKQSAVALAKDAIAHREEPEDVKNLATFILDEATLTSSQSPKVVAVRHQFSLFCENRIGLSHFVEMTLAFSQCSISFESPAERQAFPSEHRRPN